VKEVFMMSMKRSMIASALILASVNVNAGIVTNDTELLGGADHQMLSTMFGYDMDLTRIFAKQTGDTSQDWHAAVDGQGATFTVIELANAGIENMRIGGYNGGSWHSSGSWGVNATNFLFNLDTGIKYLQEGYGGTLYSTYNRGDYGPTFGAGHDINLDTNLSGGYGHTNIGNTYGERSRYGTTSYREEFAGSFNSWSVIGLETFTLSSSTGDFGTGAASTVYTQGNAVVNVSVGGLPMALSLGMLAIGGALLRRKV
jgi:hypothetical protein